MLEPIDKPLPKLPVSLHRKDTDKALDSVISLPLQRFYNKKPKDTKSRRIPISLHDNDKPVLVPTINTKLVHKEPKLDTVVATTDEPIQKTTWESDPLRLCLVDSSTTSSPIQLQTDDDQVEQETQSSMPSSQQAELPDTSKIKSAGDDVATSAYIPPTPPPKPLLKTSLSLLPVEPYAPPPTAVESWLYSRESDQSVLTIASPTIASVFLFDEEDNKEFTEETWEAIFHPLSTFRHKKGGLEYYAWNPVNLPQAAARVAQRVIHARDPDTDISPPSDATVEATIPRLMPTSSSTHSPELMFNENQKQATPITLAVPEEEGYYYDMLQKIRGGHRYSHGSSIESQLYPDNQDERLSIKSNGGTHDEQRAKSDTLKQGLVARIASASSLSAIFLGNTQNEEKKLQQEHMDPETLMQQKPYYWTEKRLFCVGFVCPLLWFYGSFQIRASSRIKDPSDLRWQKRCRMAAMYFSIVMSLVILVICVNAAGTAGVRQAQSDTIRAVIAN